MRNDVDPLLKGVLKSRAIDAFEAGETGQKNRGSTLGKVPNFVLPSAV